MLDPRSADAEKVRRRLLELLREDHDAGGGGLTTRRLIARIPGRARGEELEPLGGVRGVCEGLAADGLVVGKPVIYRGQPGVLWSLAEDVQP